MTSGYNEYSKKGQPFVIPDVAFRPQVMIPQEYISWVVEQPPNVLASRPILADRLALPYLAPTFDYHDTSLVDVLRKDLTRNIGKLQPAVFEDMRQSIDALLGVDSEDTSWREVDLFHTLEKIIFKSTSRVFVGEPLCHDKGYLRWSAAFAECLGAGFLIVGQMLPSLFKPVVGYLAAIPIYVAQRKSFTYLKPLFRQRLENMRRKKVDPSFDFEEPKDLVTWMVATALNREETDPIQLDDIAQRLLFLNLGAIHTTIVTMTNTFLDLLSSSPEQAYYTSLRSEAASIFTTEQDWADANSLAKLPIADSIIRESLRRNPILTKMMLREVMSKGGLDLPDGYHLPRGAWLGVPAVPVHHDERFYSNPQIYDPFRFVEKVPMGVREGTTATETRTRRLQGISTTSDTFLGFGHGRHSCPGRWFVAHQMKLLLAYVVTHYDIEPLDHRPLNRVIGDSVIPPQNVSIKVRRRKGH